MRVHLTSIRGLSSISALVICLATLPLLRGSEKARPIASLTANDRMHLPDSTQVTLKSGRTVSLGILRAEHQARLQRFASAARLGKAAAGKMLPTRPAIAMQTSPSRSAGGPASSAPGKAVMNKGAQQAINLSAPVLVPFRVPTFVGSMARDYVDFCNAANASMCLYLPANATLVWGGMEGKNRIYMMDDDPLITDSAICRYDLGDPSGDGGCVFWYPVKLVQDFKPGGPLDVKASCDPPAKYVVDPKGAIEASYSSASVGSPPITIGPTPVTCVVQVWVGP